MTTRKLPANASVANEGDGDKLIAPAAARNTVVLCDLLDRIAPRSGHALELASGTGQHVLAFAQRLPGLHWQPSEVDEERRASIRAYTGHIANVAPPIHLDATAPGWHSDLDPQDLLILINLLHLISLDEVTTLIAQAALSLKPKGRLVLYGPFMRSAELTSDGDKRFHAALIQQDPEIGYKNDAEIQALLNNSGLEVVEIVEMPANNLAFIAQRPLV